MLRYAPRFKLLASVLGILVEYDVPIAVGTDSHRPEEIGDRVELFEVFVEEWRTDPVTPVEFGFRK